MSDIKNRSKKAASAKKAAAEQGGKAEAKSGAATGAATGTAAGGADDAAKQKPKIKTVEGGAQYIFVSYLIFFYLFSVLIRDSKQIEMQADPSVTLISFTPYMIPWAYSGVKGAVYAIFPPRHKGWLVMWVAELIGMTAFAMWVSYKVFGHELAKEALGL